MSALLSPEDVATDLVRASGQTGPPTDLQRIIDLFPGTNVVFEPLDNDGYAVSAPGGAEILINVNTSVVRQRFTLAHELGHYALWSGLGHVADGGDERSEFERWCDRFAVGMLMPASWISRFMSASPNVPRARHLVRGPRMFQVSRQAFWLRIAEVGNGWVFEAKRVDGRLSLASELRPALPSEVITLAEECVRLASLNPDASVSAFGLSASCAALPSGSQDERRSLVVVNRD